MTLKQARFNADMTQSLLSLLTKIDVSRLSRIENNLLKPTELQAKKISKALKNKDIEYTLVIKEFK